MWIIFVKTGTTGQSYGPFDDQYEADTFASAASIYRWYGFENVFISKLTDTAK